MARPRPLSSTVAMVGSSSMALSTALLQASTEVGSSSMGRARAKASMAHRPDTVVNPSSSSTAATEPPVLVATAHKVSTFSIIQQVKTLTNSNSWLRRSCTPGRPRLLWRPPELRQPPAQPVRRRATPEPGTSRPERLRWPCTRRLWWSARRCAWWLWRPAGRTWRPTAARVVA